MRLFSIITICRNNIEELIDTHNSIKNQSFKDFEWVVIDGDSQDGTKKWLDQIKPSICISEKDNGIFDAMNKGISNSGGEYLIFMNSGDKFANDEVLEKVSKTIAQNKHPHFIYGDSIDVDENANEFYRKAKSLSRNKIGMITQHQAMFFNKAVLGDSKYSLEYPLAGDYAFISNFLNQVDKDKIIYLEFPICKFDMGGTNEIHRFKALKEDYRIRKNIIKVPFLYNVVLFKLHLLHTIMKKIRPSSRFLKHKQLSE